MCKVKILTGDNENLRSLHPKEISKQKQKCSYLFVQIKGEEARLRKCDQFSLFQSSAAGPN